MASDKKVKGCYNLECERYRKEYPYKENDKFCTICGSELVYVCKKCFKKLEDSESDNSLCTSCIAKQEARVKPIKDGADKVKAVAVAGIGIAPKAISFAKSKEGQELIKKGAAGAKLIVKMVKK